MSLTLPPPLEKALTEQARRQGVAPEALAVELLRRQLLPVASPGAVDDWERRLFAAAVDCGTSVPDDAVSSEGLYD